MSWFDDNAPDETSSAGGSSSFDEKAGARTDGGANTDQGGGGGGSSVDAQLSAAGLDKLNDPTIKADIERNLSYAQNAGKDPQEIIDNVIKRNELRFNNAPNSTYHPDGKGGYMTGPTSSTQGGVSMGGWGGPTPYQPFNEQFQAPTSPTDLLDPWTKSFNAPTAPTDLMAKWDKTFSWNPNTNANSPALQFRQQQEQQAAERSAASRGSLLTGGFQQELQDRAAGVAAQYENDDFSRALSAYNTDYSTFTGDKAARGQQYQNDFNNALSGYTTDYSTFTGDKAQRASIYNSQFNNARNAYLDKANIWDTNQNGMYTTARTNRMDDQSILNDNRNFGLAQQGQTFGQGMALNQFGLAQNAQQFGQSNTLDRNSQDDLRYLTDLGYGATTNLGQFGSNYAAGAGNTTTDIGNANAAGMVGAGNAWQNGVNGAVNAGVGAWQLRSGGGARRGVPVSTYGYTPYTT